MIIRETLGSLNFTKKLLESCKKAEKEQEITEDIIDLNITKQDFLSAITTVEEWVLLQKRINFTKAYALINKENPYFAINLKELYKKTLRFNKYIENETVITEAQKTLDFIFEKNKAIDIDFAHGISIAMLGSYFLRQVTQAKDNIFSFIIAVSTLFEDLYAEDQEEFSKKFGIMYCGEQVMTVWGNEDMTFKRRSTYLYQQRVIDYLTTLKQKYNQSLNLILLTGLYFLNLYFNEWAFFTMNGFNKEEFIENEEALLNSLENQDIQMQVKIWQHEYGIFDQKQINTIFPIPFTQVIKHIIFSQEDIFLFNNRK